MARTTVGLSQQVGSAVNSAPAIQTGATALAANKKRNWFFIQNQGTNPLFICFGSGASTSQYHMILKASTGAVDGSGGTFSSDAVAYTGILTVAGTSPSYTTLEL